MSRHSLNILLIWRRGYEDVWRGAEILSVRVREALKNQ